MIGHSGDYRPLAVGLPINLPDGQVRLMSVEHSEFTASKGPRLPWRIEVYTERGVRLREHTLPADERPTP